MVDRPAQIDGLPDGLEESALLGSLLRGAARGAGGQAAEPGAGPGGWVQPSSPPFHLLQEFICECAKNWLKYNTILIHDI
jgi:hypothetical protein